MPRRIMFALLLGWIWACSVSCPQPFADHARSALIIDQLAATHTNDEFVRAATELLQEAGFQVRYVPAEQVTVDFYRALPSKRYDLLLVRSHASATQHNVGSSAATTNQSSLFTNEPFPEESQIRSLDDALLTELRDRALLRGTYAPDPARPPFFYVITSRFISDSSVGTFDGAVVILMGCAGLSSPHLADAFISKGASSFVSWDTGVTAQHNDVASLELLRNLTVNSLTVEDAVSATNASVGPDPLHGARLQHVARD